MTREFVIEMTSDFISNWLTSIFSGDASQTNFDLSEFPSLGNSSSSLSNMSLPSSRTYGKFGKHLFIYI